ncbi:FAD-dependent monooxygenase [Streptomyces massasporeus]
MLLLGDAAHVHSAIGGPGLNLGLQDAVDLGWKPAAELRGHAPQGLLDTYDLEPYPAAQRVNMHTQAQSLLIRPGGDVTALRELFGELLAQPATRKHIANLLSGADITYDMGRRPEDLSAGGRRTCRACVSWPVPAARSSWTRRAPSMQAPGRRKSTPQPSRTETQAGLVAPAA